MLSLTRRWTLNRKKLTNLRIPGIDSISWREGETETETERRTQQWESKIRGNVALSF